MLVVLILVLLAAPLSSAQPEEADRGLRERYKDVVVEYNLVENDLFRALHKVASDFVIPVGIEWIRGPNTMRPISMSWRRTTVAELVGPWWTHIPGTNSKQPTELYTCTLKNTFAMTATF